MLTVYAPDNYRYEREYIFEVIFSCFWRIDYNIIFEPDRSDVLISGQSGTVSIKDVLFSIAEKDWLSSKCLPNMPLNSAVFDSQLLSSFNDIPVLYGQPFDSGNYLDIKDESISLGIDIFGAAFFMLTRLEEYVSADRDNQDRFPVESSIAYKAGFLDYPIVNEYLELLWLLIKQIEPKLERKNCQYRVVPTHDIDNPFGMMFETPFQILRHFAGDILYRKSIGSLLDRVREVLKCYFLKEQYIAEYSKTFDFILAESKKHCLRDIFFFMNSKKSWYDGNYTVDEPHVLVLINKLINNGHSVGLHPSFVSYNDSDEIKKEVDFMNSILSRNQLPMLVGARQHYFKWKNPDTWQYYENVGIPFDSSMIYAGQVGYRCGVCYPYPVFNLESRKKLKLVERPLIVMDRTLYEYMGLSYDEALPVIKKLANECKKYDGEFVILWHNTMLDNEAEREFYSRVLDAVCCE